MTKYEYWWRYRHGEGVCGMVRDHSGQFQMGQCSKYLAVCDPLPIEMPRWYDVGSGEGPAPDCDWYGLLDGLISVASGMVVLSEDTALGWCRGVAWISRDLPWPPESIICLEGHSTKKLAWMLMHLYVMFYAEVVIILTVLWICSPLPLARYITHSSRHNFALLLIFIGICVIYILHI